jgi:transposase, IS30 family
MPYIRVTVIERRLIRMWCRAGYGQREIARRMNRAPSTVCREIARNTGGCGYQPEQAHRTAQERAKRPRPRKFTDEMKVETEARLQEGWTPEIISGRARMAGRLWVCKETIYKHIYEDAHAGGDLWEHLPRARRQRWRRCPRNGRQRERISNKQMIDIRPPEVETRSTVGHWEGDLICGARRSGHLVTLVERRTRFTLLARSSTKETREVTRIIGRLLGKMPTSFRSTLTLDNGVEFAWHEKLAARTDINVFFAHPYHSWERGTNENTNGLIRRIYPKKSSFAFIERHEIKCLDSFLNDRPRKCLGWKTPREMMIELTRL